ncbi:phage antirepressor N-terminal domain-containing protein [Acinetobacter sp. SH20PTE14]|uniref:phage antirepressor N-terminal domain-containing protein n=1 Tax=Acinetobacter sp. SH20PTE14 TaxID=2905879 RepID=UPI001F316384|nr:phage antirepressor N-terminal domain-containing protein [Acinetobacter sp. SH20PTE14]UIJ76959.1 phage antirepressor N-terminal domain-containing protein [Acinetobacter sp. SH20PTE14]UIJ77022.1 phage antirepressor N-terminal domain-containing protein [Acinetobacter sp. SH20PTE14]
MNSLTQIAVPFHNSELIVVDYNNQPYTAMRPIVEGMGLAWQAQFDKLKQRFGSVIMEIMTTGKDGKQYQMLCLPLKKLFGWLMTISPNKVKPELRDTVIKYQSECDDVLWDYWTKGKAVNPRKTTPKERENLRHAVSNLVSRVKINFSDAYNMVLQRFNVEHIEEIPLDNLDDAVEYVHGLILTFDKVQQHSPVDINAVQDCHGVLQYRLIEYHSQLEKEVKRLGGKMPEHPSFNPDQVAQALMSRILQGKQMMIKLNYQGGFSLDLIPRDAVMVDANSIPELVNRTDLVSKEQLPLIVQNAMGRLVK